MKHILFNSAKIINGKSNIEFYFQAELGQGLYGNHENVLLLYIQAINSIASPIYNNTNCLIKFALLYFPFQYITMPNFIKQFDGASVLLIHTTYARTHKETYVYLCFMEAVIVENMQGWIM